MLLITDTDVPPSTAGFVISHALTRIKVHLVRDKKTSTSRGTAFIQFYEPLDAVNALAELDGRPFQGRLLHILPASDKKDNKMTDFEISKLPLKKQKALKRKAEASSASFSWNSLYMNPDAVLASVANRLGVTKSDLLDPSSADAAVKQAQAETTIIQETKDYLRSQGINIDAFKNHSRDERCLLLKNFPFGTTSEELSTMLSEFGTIDRVIFPPSGTMAIALFQEPHASRDAMKALAYKNLKGSVLYLERAPADLFDIASTTAPPAEKPLGQDKTPESNTIAPTASVFVRNLNFATTSSRLTEVFSSLAGFLSARVKTRVDASRPNEILSMGFGFVEFRSRKHAEAAAAAMDKHRLDGHEILAQISQKQLDAAEERRTEDSMKKEDQQKTKLVIKNLPFEASKKDIKTLLGGYGTLRSVRMPRKFDRSARGFAFADFVTPKEARNAMEALSSTHLLGRRLVIDFAEGDVDDPEEAIKALEKKAGRQVHLNAVNKLMTGSSRKKFNVDAREEED
jgi:multiple RNA-binding domain-containing protein 1